MKIKRFFATVLFMAYIAIALAGCGQGVKESMAGEFKDSNEKIKLRWLSYPTNFGAKDGTVPQRALEERFNVEIEPMFYDSNGFQEKKNMLLASNDIPDLIYELDPIFVQNDADQDFISELPYDVIKKYAPNYYKYLSEYAPAAWIYSAYDDANWGLPNYDHSYMQSKQAIYRKDWLEKLGKEVPKTLDELHDVLYAFANGDPDGNGKKDTYGISAGSHYQSYFSEIFGAYGCLPFDWQEKDGKIVYGGVTDECKQALKTLSEWYKDGILHPDFILGTNDRELMSSNKLGYMCDYGYQDMSDPNSLANVLAQNVDGGEITLGLLPIGPDGKSGARSWGRASHVISFGNNENCDVKIPRMLKIMEGLFNDKELYTVCKIGNEGESWEKAANSQTTENFVMINGNNDPAVARINGLNNGFASPSFFAPVVTDYDNYMSTRSEAWKAWQKIWMNEKYSLTDYFFKVDVVPSAAEYIVDLRVNQTALMNEIIMGKKPLKAYDDFIAEWNNGGGKIMTEEANELKAGLKKIYKEIGA